MQEIHEKGLPHRIVYIICRNEKGLILLQKRSPNMLTYPNLWDVSAAGHVDEGEAYEVAAERELREELGVSGYSLREVDAFYDEHVFEGRRMKRFCKVYTVDLPANIKLTIDPEEISDTRWLSLAEVKRLLKLQPEQAAIGLAACLKGMAA